VRGPVLQRCRPRVIILMNKDWVLTQQAFDSLLTWLDTDRERAAAKYETIRVRLIKILTCRGCCDAEELADETINRVTGRLAQITGEYEGDPALYFYGVCQRVHREYLRKAHSQRQFDSACPSATSLAAPTINDGIESDYACLEQCLERLPADHRELVVRYYQHEQKAKTDRKLLAQELGIAVNALRIRAHRIRLTLESCVRNCLEQQPAH